MACLVLMHTISEVLAFRGCYCAEILSKPFINNQETCRNRIATSMADLGERLRESFSLDLELRSISVVFVGKSVLCLDGISGGDWVVCRDVLWKITPPRPREGRPHHMRKYPQVHPGIAELHRVRLHISLQSINFNFHFAPLTFLLCAIWLVYPGASTRKSALQRHRGRPHFMKPTLYLQIVTQHPNHSR